MGWKGKGKIGRGNAKTCQSPNGCTIGQPPMRENMPGNCCSSCITETQYGFWETKDVWKITEILWICEPCRNRYITTYWKIEKMMSNMAEYKQLMALEKDNMYTGVKNASPTFKYELMSTKAEVLRRDIRLWTDEQQKPGEWSDKINKLEGELSAVIRNQSELKINTDVAKDVSDLCDIS